MKQRQKNTAEKPFDFTAAVFPQRKGPYPGTREGMPPSAPDMNDPCKYSDLRPLGGALCLPGLCQWPAFAIELMRLGAYSGGPAQELHLLPSLPAAERCRDTQINLGMF